MGGILYFVIIIAVFYFFLIAPEKKKQTKAKNMMNNLKVGDVVVTRGGIQGTIIKLNETLATIATGPDEVKIDLTRQAIGSIIESAPISDEEYEEEEEYEDEEDEEYEDEEEETTSEENGSISLDKK